MSDVTSGAFIQPTTYYSGDRREMLSYVPASSLSVLEIGCGAGNFGALLRMRNSQCRVTGVEVHSEAARMARQKIDLVIEGSIDLALDDLVGSSFDCIVCNDVLEHLVDPWDTLVRLRGLLNSHGVLIASIPNIRYYPVLREYLSGEWRYQACGVLDRTHLRFFTRYSIPRLFSETGYRMDVLEGIFPLKLPWKARVFNSLFSNFLDDTRYERFACVVRLPPSD